MPEKGKSKQSKRFKFPCPSKLGEDSITFSSLAFTPINDLGFALQESGSKGTSLLEEAIKMFQAFRKKQVSGSKGNICEY